MSDEKFIEDLTEQVARNRDYSLTAMEEQWMSVASEDFDRLLRLAELGAKCMALGDRAWTMAESITCYGGAEADAGIEDAAGLLRDFAELCEAKKGVGG